MESNLEARSRDTFGKNAARRTRAAGWIPAVVYGGHAQGERPVGHPISVDPKALYRILHSDSGVNTLIGLKVDDAEGPTRVLVREYQLDPVTHTLLHADFYRVAMDRLLTVTVPIVLRGEAQGVKLQGGVVDFVNRDIEVECLPADIPDEIVVDISELMIGQALRVRDLSLSYALMHRHNIAHERREGLLFDLAADFDRRRYFSTQERMGLFLAVRSAIGKGAEAGTDIGWKTTLSQGSVSGAWTGSGTQQQSIVGQKLKSGVSLRNDGASTVYLEVNAQGYPVKPMAVQEDRIKLERTLWTTEGKPATGRQFTTGEMLIVRLRVQAKQNIKDGLVVDRIPAGFEVENLNLSQGPQAGEFKVEGVNIATANANERIVHIEYRDDRFVVAAKLGGEVLDLFYLVRAVTSGRYVVPAPFAEDMYRPEIRGIGKGEADITVVDKRAAP